MSDEPTPVFQIQRVYLKDLSLEQPNSPAIFLEQEGPGMEVAIDIGAEKLADGIHEATITVTVTAKIRDKVAFLVECKHAGIFEARNIPEDQVQGLVSFLNWALTTGQGSTFLYNGYVSLPTAVRNAAIAELHKIKYNGTPVWP